MKIDVYSHCFSISEIENRFEGLVRRLSRENAEYDVEKDEVTGASYTKVARMWSFSNNERTRFNFHIHYFNAFMGWVNGIEDLAKSIVIVRHEYDLNEAAPAKFKILKIFEPRDYQETLIQVGTKEGAKNDVITLPPGAGKTLTAFHVMERLKVRTFITMKGGYLDRWIPDLEKTFDLKGGRMLVIRGQADLINLMEMAVCGDLKADIIITTIDTISGYIKEYSKFPHIRERYPYSPTELFQKLGVGLAVLDEGHQNPHKVMRLFCHTNVPKFLTLSATLDTRDPFLNKRYQVMYPESERHNAGYSNIYIGVNAMMYRIAKIKGIRTTGFRGAYSHVNFEQSLLRSQHRATLKGYLGLVKYSVDLKFIHDYKPGTKCLLFFATVNMCDKAVAYLSEKYPHLKVVRYTAKDKMTALEEGDIIVSTVLSAGTAVDIIDLRTTIMTTALDSQIANEQSLGRTRPVKSYPDVTPEFCYFVCLDIPKQLQYHRNKKMVFNGLVKYHNEVTLPYPA